MAHDPLAPAVDDAAVDLETDTDTEVESSGVTLLPNNGEQEDGQPVARRADTPGDSASEARRADDGDDDADADGTDRRTAAERARDDQGRFAKPDAGKKPDRFERRITRKRDEINAATRELTTVRQQREAEERELTRIRAEKASLAGDAAGKPPQTAAEAKATLGTKPDWRQYQDEGKSWEEYEADKEGWLLDQAEARSLAKIEARQKEEKAAAERDRQTADRRAMDQAYAQKIDATKAKYADFDALVEAAEADDVEVHDFIGAAVRLVDQGGDLLYTLLQPDQRETVEVLGEFLEEFEPKATFPLMEALRTSADPARLLLACADPQRQTEVRTALRSSEAKALVALVRLDERLSAGAQGSPRPATSVRKAAPPPSHRAGSHSAGAGRASGDSEDTDTYVRRRQREEADQRAKRFA